MKIVGIERLTVEAIDAVLERGGRFVYYEYCISLPFITFRKPTSIRLLPPGNRGVVRGLPFAMLTLAFGWWGVLCGALYVLAVIFANLGSDGLATAAAEGYLDSGYIVALLVFGWWGLPWGLLYGVQAILIDLGGGHDVTRQVRRFVQEAALAEPV